MEGRSEARCLSGVSRGEINRSAVIKDLQTASGVIRGCWKQLDGIADQAVELRCSVCLVKLGHSFVNHLLGNGF